MINIEINPKRWLLKTKVLFVTKYPKLDQYLNVELKQLTLVTVATLARAEQNVNIACADVQPL